MKRTGSLRQSGKVTESWKWMMWEGGENIGQKIDIDNKI